MAELVKVESGLAGCCRRAQPDPLCASLYPDNNSNGVIECNVYTEVLVGSISSDTFHFQLLDAGFVPSC